MEIEKVWHMGRNLNPKVCYSIFGPCEGEVFLA